MLLSGMQVSVLWLSVIRSVCCVIVCPVTACFVAACVDAVCDAAADCVAIWGAAVCLVAVYAAAACLVVSCYLAVWDRQELQTPSAGGCITDA